MTVKELINELKAFPEDREILNYEYFSIKSVYEDVYPVISENSPERDKKYVIIS